MQTPFMPFYFIHKLISLLLLLFLAILYGLFPEFYQALLLEFSLRIVVHQFLQTLLLEFSF